MKYTAINLFDTRSNKIEEMMVAEKRRQAGIAFPAPRKQNYLLVIRLDLESIHNKKLVSQGLRRLCTLFEQIDRNLIEIEDTTGEGIQTYPLTEFNFTATIGFGMSFFRKLDLVKKCPKNFTEMPAYFELGDKSPYVLPPTDLIVQLASNNYVLNKMILQNDNYLYYIKRRLTRQLGYLALSDDGSSDLLEATKGWSKIIDVQNGFHRADGRNLMGFYDGISNPYRLANNNIWISENEEKKEFVDGTYMVFQKIEHNLRQWKRLNTQEQEKSVGRSKATGLLLGTLSIQEEKNLVSELFSINPSIQRQAKSRLSKLINEQRDPTKNFFDAYDVRYMNINKKCLVSSHARRANPRKSNGKKKKFIFRRGYLYLEENFVDYPKSGILFISFQNDIKTFEEMKRNLSQQIGIPSKTRQSEKLKNYFDQGIDINNRFDTLTIGGGYYFVPPIKKKKISEIGQQFFE